MNAPRAYAAYSARLLLSMTFKLFYNDLRHESTSCCLAAFQLHTFLDTAESPMHDVSLSARQVRPFRRAVCLCVYSRLRRVVMDLRSCFGTKPRHTLTDLVTCDRVPYASCNFTSAEGLVHTAASGLLSE